MAESKRVIGTTPNGKNIILISKNHGHFEVAFESGGELPQELKGKYTTPSIARDRVKYYLEKQAAKQPTSKKAG